jgi:hypothetical protein
MVSESVVAREVVEASVRIQGQWLGYEWVEVFSLNE